MSSYKQADRRLSKLKPVFKRKVKQFLKDAKAEGYDIFITEGFRSLERQKWLYGQGRPLYEKPYGRAGSIVTWTLNSTHQSGEAIDIAFRGAKLYPSNHNTWRGVANIAKKNGLSWGYDLWKFDKPHFQNDKTIPEIDTLNQQSTKVSQKQKQLIENAISALKALHDSGNRQMKLTAHECANQLRKLKE